MPNKYYKIYKNKTILLFPGVVSLFNTDTLLFGNQNHFVDLT